MAGIAMFLPNEEMVKQAQRIMDHHKNHVVVVKQIRTENAVEEAREVASEGVNVIIARGQQAMMIKRYTNIPVVDIVMTAQELGILIVKAKKMIGKDFPKIALIGWKSMLCDTTYFNDLYDIELKRYVVEDEENMQKSIEEALEEHVDLIIGGETVLRRLEGVEVPFLFLDSIGESISVALSNAETLFYANQVERYNYAQLSSLLDTAFNGFVKVSSQGEILVMNHVMEGILKVPSNDVVGKHFTEVLKGIDVEAVERVLTNPKESYSAFVNVGDEALVVVIVPIVMEDKIDGAIFSCNRIRKPEKIEASRLKEQYLSGYVAVKTFHDINCRSNEMKKTIELAKFYAQSSSPILLVGEIGDEREDIAQSIHNYSLKKTGPYISTSIIGLSDHEQMELLFGKQVLDRTEENRGLMLEANHGTLMIYSIDKMGLRTQYYLSQMIKNRTLVKMGVENIQVVDTRIIGSCTDDLLTLFNDGDFCEELYYMFHTMSLRISPLRERKEDMEGLIDFYVKTYMKKYSRYHVFSAGAKAVLMRHRWKGNYAQLETFCERMVLTVGKRIITEEYVEELLLELYPEEVLDEKAEGELELEKDPFVVVLKETLKKYNGNRGLTAKALNISTTTLWRKINKHGLE